MECPHGLAAAASIPMENPYGVAIHGLAAAAIIPEENPYYSCTLRLPAGRADYRRDGAGGRDAPGAGRD